MASIFSSVTSPSWGWIWFLIEAICIILVVIGCAGEVLVDRHKFFDKVKSDPKSGRLEEKKLASEIKEWWKVFFGVIVVIGLSFELLAFCFSFLCSNREIEGLKSDNIVAAKQLEAQIAQTRTNVARIDPLTKPIFDVSAFVFFKVKHANDSDFPSSLSPLVASLTLCKDKIWNQTSISLTATNFIRGRGPPSFTPANDWRSYSMQFPSDGLKSLADGFGLKVKDLSDNFNVLRIDLSFLRDSEILGGTAEIIVNNGEFRKFFTIFTQTNNARAPVPLWNISYMIIATNSEADDTGQNLK